LTGLGLGARAQQPAAAPVRPAAAAAAVAAAPRAVPSSKEAEPPASNSAGHQGIRVHGHWVLQVKNPDGTLGERREFENSLTTLNATATLLATGDQLLGLLLSGNAAAGDPAVVFSNAVPAGNPEAECFLFQNGGPPAFTPGGAACGVLTTKQSVFTGSVQTGLATTLATYPAVSWLLTGNYTVVSGQTQIASVQTLMSVCTASNSINPTANSVSEVNNPTQSIPGAIFDSLLTSRTATASPAACNYSQDTTLANSPYYSYILPTTLTSTAVTDSSGNPSPLTVSPGRVVQVTVTISFS